ncbi:1,4-dihydroxy-2-naphthoate polyprenyltransferase [Metabacillus sp. GX 13764]|uniref:1,4-dihydroxy-2-naphthoate polyprenyltransferase n=1 Tax=Metabacillus kandeliae TaxID=2900151 RepID=UPI001E40F08B|nr:1,4-dihydroxy-2-naphthoate polyprenyltransferase [Metabacillus kandeliae]MCD7032608.1 1,4-dihydroxy-2-naphthoate polyprenyltransferase [Metabacillus kandeliae]
MHPDTQTSDSGVRGQGKNWRVWWMLMRPHTLTAAFIPVTLGTVMALKEGSFHIWLFLAMLLASLLIQAATNMFNEYFDFKRGLDNKDSVGIGGAIVRDGVKPSTVLNLAFIFFGISALLGVYICFASSWWIALIGTFCMAAGYFYSGGPRPIAYTPFGELTSGLLMGVVIILISFFIQTDAVTMDSFLISIPVSLLIGAINLANNIRDHDGDKLNGRKTLAILFGQKNAIRFLAFIFTLSYLLVIAFILFHITSFWSLLVFLSLPKSISAIKSFIGKKRPVEMMPAMRATAQTNTQFGFLLAIGVFISYLL